MDETTFGPSNLPKQAMEAALESRWEEALQLNQEILKVDPVNIDALNRLAKAYFELGDLLKAKKFYTLTLKYDQYNPIALKNLKIIQTFKGNYQVSNNHSHNGRISPSIFLQEPGRTKIVSLIKVAEPQKLSSLFCGMMIELHIRSRGVSVVDNQGDYLGALPDDTAYQMVRLIKGGNKYNIFVQSIKVNGLTVLIREVFRSSRFKNQPSFLDSNQLNFEITTIQKNSEEEFIPSEEEEE